MASYEEAQGSGGLYGAALSFAPWLVAGHFQGQEEKMFKATRGLTSRAFGSGGKKGLTRTMAAFSRGRPMAGRLGERFAQKGALTIAKTHGAFSAGAWSAAGRAGAKGTLARIAASRAAGMFFTGFNIYMFARLLYSGVKGAVNSIRKIGREAERLEFGGDYIDTRGAYTERQRSLRAITSSRMSTRAAIGGEAFLMHR